MKDWDDNTLYASIPDHQDKLLRMNELFENDEYSKYAGLDFAPLHDLSSISVVVRDPLTQEVYFRQKSWSTEIEASRKSKADGVPFNRWAEMGYLTILPYKTIEPDLIGEYMVIETHNYTIKSFAYDAYRISKTIDKLVSQKRITIPAIGIPNTPASLNEASTVFADLVINNKLLHIDDPLLRHCADSVTVVVNHSGLIKPERTRNAGLVIDPIVAGIYAIDCMIREESRLNRNVIPFKSEKNMVGGTNTVMHGAPKKLGMVESYGTASDPEFSLRPRIVGKS